MVLYAQHDGQGEKQHEKQGKPDRPQGRQDKGAPQQQHAPQAEQQQRQHGQKGQQQEHAQQPEQQPQQARQSQQVQQYEQSQRQQQRVQQQQQRPPQQVQEQRQPYRAQQQARAWQQQRGWLQQGGGWQGHDTWQQSRARRWSSDHRSWAQRGGYGGYYIPQDRFSLYFGSQHSFRLRARPVMYMGYPRFEYSGFSFLLVDPWPEYWSENWYDSDDVYIDDHDGYYLYNRRYPEVRLAITIAL